MTRTGWRRGLADLARDVTRVLFIYALVLQGLAPLAMIQAEARDGLNGHGVLCSAMMQTGVEHPAKAPVHVVHDCLSCCLGSVVGVLPTPTELREPASFSWVPTSLTPEAFVLPARAGSPPPQRAPPSLA